MALPHKPPPSCLLPTLPPLLCPHFLPPQVKNYRVTRQRMQLPDDGTRGEATLEYASGLQGLTPRQLDVFIQQIIAKYEVKRIHPGGEGGRRMMRSGESPGGWMCSFSRLLSPSPSMRSRGSTQVGKGRRKKGDDWGWWGP